MDFHTETNDLVKHILTKANESGIRVRIWLGNTQTGEAWTEEYDVVGSIGKSCGVIKVPLLIRSTRSTGGGAILDQHIVRIDNIQTKETLYKHPKFHTDVYLSTLSKTAVVNSKNQIVANLASEQAAIRYVQFMSGKRYSK